MNENSRQKKCFPLPVFIIFILSFLPVYYTWGKVLIGGDTNIPYSSQTVLKYLYQWVDVQNGIYFSVNLYPLYFFYKIAEFFGVTYYGVSTALLFCINFVAGLGIYKLASLYYKGERPNSFTIPVVFYLLSPALLNSWHYLYIYAFAPWFMYFVAKFIKRQMVSPVDIIWLNLVIFFASLDLPNPKYVFYLVLSGVVYVLFGYVLKLFNLAFLLRILLVFFISLPLSAYLLLPLHSFVTRYSPAEYGVSVNPGGGSGGKMMDSGTATINKMFRLHHNGININKEESNAYLSSPLVTLIGYSFMALFLLDLIRRKKDQKKEENAYRQIYFVLILLFLGLAAGPNPPFGVIYKFFVFNIAPLAFLRTTAGAVFIMSMFYAIYLFMLVQKDNLQTKITHTFIVLAVLITGYPTLFGDFYENNTRINQFAKENQRGFTLPKEYETAATLLNNQKIDTKVLYPGSDPSYISTRWGYFGPLIHSFLYRLTPLSYQSIVSDPIYHNVGFSVVDSSLITSAKDSTPEGNLVFSDGILNIYNHFNSDYLPHIYVPKDPQGIKNGNSQPPQLEYKKINPTKYKVLVHKAKDNFQLVFSEKYNKDWELYKLPNKNQVGILNLDYKEKVQLRYGILPDNEHTQATKQELLGFIQNGYISSLGSATNYQESKIDFVSKNFHNTIQNDNLPSGVFFENWNKKPIFKESHRLVNGFANSWDIIPSNICNDTGACKLNPDGSLDFELVIEFYPQRFFYYGAIISFLTLTVLLTISLVVKKKRE